MKQVREATAPHYIGHYRVATIRGDRFAFEVAKRVHLGRAAHRGRLHVRLLQRFQNIRRRGVVVTGGPAAQFTSTRACLVGYVRAD